MSIHSSRVYYADSINMPYAWFVLWADDLCLIFRSVLLLEEKGNTYTHFANCLALIYNFVLSTWSSSDMAFVIFKETKMTFSRTPVLIKYTS